MDTNTKGDPRTAEVIPNRGLTNHKRSVPHKRLLRQARKFIIDGLVIVSLLGVFAGCSTENIGLSLALMIPSLIYLGLYVWANNI